MYDKEADVNAVAQAFANAAPKIPSGSVNAPSLAVAQNASGQGPYSESTK
jgi:hypothetical protein